MSASDKIGVTLTIVAVIVLMLVGCFVYYYNQQPNFNGGVYTGSPPDMKIATNPGTSTPPSEK